MNSKKKIINVILMIIFPPYIIYFFIKNKLFKRIYILMCVILFIFASILIIYPSKHENDFHEYLANKTYAEFEKHNNYLELGKKRFINKIARMTIDDIMYDKFRLLTNTGIYELYLGSDTGKQYDIDAIYQKFPNTKLVYVAEGKEKYFDNILPYIKKYISDNEEVIGKFDSLLEYNEDDNIYKINTSNGVYNIFVTYDQVSKVTDENEIIIYEEEVTPELIPQIEDVIKLNPEVIGNIKNIIYNQIYVDKQESLLETDQGTFLITYYDDGDVEILKKNEL